MTVKAPAPVALLTTGPAVNVSGPGNAIAGAVVVLLVTVTKPDFVDVLAVAVVKAGAGPVNAGLPPVTVNGLVLLVPPGVVTPKFRTPSGARREMFKVAVTVVAFTTVRLVTGMNPATPVIAKAPLRLVP